VSGAETVFGEDEKSSSVYRFVLSGKINAVASTKPPGVGQISRAWHLVERPPQRARFLAAKRFLARMEPWVELAAEVTTPKAQSSTEQEARIEQIAMFGGNSARWHRHGLRHAFGRLLAGDSRCPRCTGDSRNH
jgi:hypothetical protein